MRRIVYGKQLASSSNMIHNFYLPSTGPLALLILVLLLILAVCQRHHDEFYERYRLPLSVIYNSAKLPCDTEAIRQYRTNSRSLLVSTTTTPPFKISLHSQLDDIIRWSIAEDGQYYEKNLTSLAQHLLLNRPQGLVVDVGANIGWLSLYAMAMGHRVMRYWSPFLCHMSHLISDCSFEPSSRNLAK